MSDPPDGAPGARGRWPRIPAPVLVALALGVGLALRLANAQTSSLWLDDFHSLHHARADSLGGVLASLGGDNHPPLSFLLLHAARGLLGEAPWALRTPNLLVGVLALLWVARLGGRLGPVARPLAVLWVAVSALHVDQSTNLRMYALLALAVLGTLEALVRELDEGRGGAWTVLWVAVGLHAHYHFLYALGILALGTCVLLLSVPAYRPRTRAVTLHLGLGVVLALPWYLLGFPGQLAHGLAPGGSSVSLGRLGSALLHQLHLGLGDHGPRWRVAFAGGGACALLLAAWGGLARAVRDARAGRPAAAWLLLAVAFGLPLATALVAWLVPRAGFEPRYLVGAMGPLALLAAWGATTSDLPLRGLRALFGGYGLVTSLALAVALARSPGHEDYRDATRHVLEAWRPGDAVLAADWQPAVFPQGIGWAYYAPRLGRARDGSWEPPPRLTHDATFTLEDPGALDAYRRVHCILRSIPHGAAMLRQLRAHFGPEETLAFGRGVAVLRFGPP